MRCEVRALAAYAAGTCLGAIEFGWLCQSKQVMREFLNLQRSVVVPVDENEIGRGQRAVAAVGNRIPRVNDIEVGRIDSEQ